LIDHANELINQTYILFYLIPQPSCNFVLSFSAPVPAHGKGHH